jgi:hypothetical protein
MSTGVVKPLADGSAARVIRALLDFRCVWTTHDLVTISELPAQTVRKVIGCLENEALVQRTGPGVVLVPSWLALLRRWSQDARFGREAQVTRWRSKGGVQALLTRLPTTPVSYTISGIAAAQQWVPRTPAGGPTIIYTPDAQVAATAWELVPATTSSIVLAEPASDVVFVRPRKTPTGLRMAAPAQVLADLLTGAGRSPSAADQLSSWMLSNELQWRY